MRILKTVLILNFVLLAMSVLGCQKTNQTLNNEIDLSRQEKLYYGIKINNVTCGYAEITQEFLERDGKEMLKIADSTFMMLSALGAKFNLEIHSTFFVDPISGQFVYQKNHIKQGAMDFTAEATVEDSQIIVKATLSEGIDTVAIDSDVVLRNDQFLPFLVKDFSDSSVHEKTYRYFEIKDQEVQQTTFKRLPDVTITLAGRKFQALVFEEMNQKTGSKMKWWLDKRNGYLLRGINSRGETFLADASVKDKIKLGSMDDLIIFKTNVSIGDFQAISYMKINAKLEPIGLRITPQNLNVPGQKFIGTVTDNLIDGVFEIEYPHYNGKDAPPFPPDFSEVDSVQPFLQPTALIESDDPVLIQKAKAITAGSKNSWEAAIRLSQWVADSIAYSVPGGATALNTYNLRKGECGAHSNLLAAFCQAVGIPARLVWGCMYVPNRGGAFSKHGWTEIYMGKAGWIPV
ncbi:MAG: transglutaminase domain-containing protein, partial [Calditrichaeota bacterium]|nr:transglutaminase domain-containing protein [Calditrichota bacterium]